MKKRLLMFALILLASVLVSPGGGGGGKAYAYAQQYETELTVYYVCQISPPVENPVGWWHVDCDGTMTGWGDPPRYSNSCYSVQSERIRQCNRDCLSCR